MRNRMYGGVRGRKTKVGEKLHRFPPTRLCRTPHKFSICRRIQLVTLAVSVARHKLVHATCGIHEFRFTSIEWVTGVRNLQLDEWIGSAIDLDAVLRVSCRATEELCTIGHIFENYNAVVLWMNSFFHVLFPFLVLIQQQQRST